MKIEHADLRQLRLPLAACLALILAGVLCAFAAHDRLRAVRMQAATAAAQREAAAAALARSTAQASEVSASLPQFQALAARGIIGTEDRLDWVESLSAIRSERRLFNIRYSIEPQRELDYPGFSRGSGIKFLASRVKISMGLLHEGDLLNLIDDLARRGKSYLSVRSCDVQRIGAGKDAGGLTPSLQADCEFDLITIGLMNHEHTSMR